jgi:FMN phosphatase YigB (HAD superfamily)
MTLQCIVLDFDGTLTDVQQESRTFFTAYKQDLCALVGADTDVDFEAACQQILQAPHDYGWQVDGHIVAPAHTDPYILASCAARLVFDKHDVMRTSDTRISALLQLFRNCYPRAGTVFRPFADEVLKALLATKIPVFIVTNSFTDDVTNKLALLRVPRPPRIFGNAKKYVIEHREHPSFAALPLSRVVEHLQRPVLLRRGFYFDVLSAIWKETGATPQTTLVCGDLFELDLALPQALGTRVHLVSRDSTALYEKAAVGSHSDDLRDILPIVTP